MRLWLITIALIVLTAVPASCGGSLAFTLAIITGDRDRVAKLVADDPSLVNQPLTAGVTPLGTAAFGGHIEIVRLLLTAGADPNAFDDYGDTALHKAVGGGSDAVVRALLDAGASIDPVDWEGRTPLYQAIEAGRVETAMLFVDRGANAFAAGGDDCAPAHAAAARGFATLTMAMLKSTGGVDTGVGLPALHRAAGLGDIAEIKRLLGSDPALANRTDVEGWTPLFWAAALGRQQAADLLLEAQADVNAVAGDGAMPLHVAASAGQAQSVELLLSRGGRAGVRDHSGQTPLYCAVGAGRLEVARTLLAHGADPNVRADTGETALLWAACRGDREVVQLLLGRGAGARIADDTGRTPLHEAAALGREAKEEAVAPEGAAIAKALLKAGADPNARDESGLTPLHEAARGGDADVVEVLLAAGADIDARDELGRSPLLYVATRRAAELLAMHGADLRLRADDGSTVLHQIVRSGPGEAGRETILYLVGRGLDINECRDDEGLTPLHLAAQGILGPEVGEFLITKAGAKVNARSSRGLTPLHFAAVAGDLALAKMLLSHGADPAAVDSKGCTALDYTAPEAKDVVALLQEYAGAAREE